MTVIKIIIIVAKINMSHSKNLAIKNIKTDFNHFYCNHYKFCYKT